MTSAGEVGVANRKSLYRTLELITSPTDLAGPGTRITETSETMDEDAVILLICSMGVDA